MDRYTFIWRILITLLILTMLLPGWGLLEVANASEWQPAMNEGAISVLSPVDR